MKKKNKDTLYNEKFDNTDIRISNNPYGDIVYKNKDDILKSIQDIKLELEQKFKMNEVSQYMNELEQYIESCKTEILKNLGYEVT